MRSVTVRYFAAAKAAAGTDRESIEIPDSGTLADVLAGVLAAHGPELAKVATSCSILVGDRPLGNVDPSDVVVAEGEEIHLLPPFAGG